MDGLANKVVWITGASSGIGEELAINYSKKGATVILSARREEELNRVAKLCLGQTFCQVLDLSKTSQVETIVENIINQFQKIDILINNGGISQRSEAYKTSLEVDRKLMEVKKV